MPGQFNLDKGGVGADAYRKLLAENMARFNGDRDRAVRSANIAGGFGSSTAQRFMGGGGAPAAAAGGGAGGGGAGGGGDAVVPLPAARPTRSPTSEPGFLPSPHRTPTDVENPTLSPTSQPGFYPPPSPPRDPSLMWPGATGGGPAMQDKVPQNAQNGGVPMNPAMSMASILRGVPPELQAPLIAELFSGGRGMLNTSVPPELVNAGARVPSWR